MIDYDFKEKLESKKESYIEMMSYIFSKYTNIEKEKLKEYASKKFDIECESFFKNISEDKYNSESINNLDNMSLEEINKKSIKD
jgi:hypothetical protein